MVFPLFSGLFASFTAAARAAQQKFLPKFLLFSQALLHWSKPPRIQSSGSHRSIPYPAPSGTNSRTNSLKLMWTCLPSGKHRRIRRFYRHNLNLRVLLFQEAAHSGNRPACTDARYKQIYHSVCIPPDLRSCSLKMSPRIDRISN